MAESSANTANDTVISEADTLQDLITAGENALEGWKKYELKDTALWEAFKHDFQDFSKEDFNRVPINFCYKIRSYLRQHGVWVNKQSKVGNVSDSLYFIAQVEEQIAWTELELKICKNTEPFDSDMINQLFRTDFGRNLGYSTGLFFSTPPPPLPAPPLPPPVQLAQERLQQVYNPLQDMNPTPSNEFALRNNPPAMSSRPSTDGEEIANLVDMYTEELKYSGENDSFTFKLNIFHDRCARGGVPQEAKLKAFPIMLKGLAMHYYYSNISSRNAFMTFDEVCYMIQSYFEGAEYKRNILSKWNAITLRSVMMKSENKGKSLENCLHLLIRDLRHFQYGLDPEFRTDRFIYNKLIDACRDVPACQYACSKPAETLGGLINDLRSSITTFVNANPSETFFTNRRYHKH